MKSGLIMEDSVWGSLGDGLMLPSKVMKEVMLLRDRVLALEQEVTRLQREKVAVDQELELVKQGVFAQPVITPRTNGSEFNAFAYMQSEELEDIADRDIEEEEEGELEPLIRVKSGLVAPPPKRPAPMELEPSEGDIDYSDNDLSMEEEVHSQMKVADMIDTEHPDLLKERRGTPEDWMYNTLQAMEENGGVINSYLKRQGLIPEDISDEERVEYKLLLLKHPHVRLHKVNKLRHFYFLDYEANTGDRLDAEEEYERFVGRRADQ